ncbi:carbohydrate kinase [Streptomyces calidiresistens]|uniref:Carbohydrate kinase n=1 Tax=Streptomyces calidiresistens TaxID=1485586 RepID=A0A7W3XVN0_9ACTN|nr:PfkB family carbohydrate kinase [Streptomyces calidiresistens]MBB0228969.1 carbohydrate kinase [Streptomyces calidiresistens]
MNGTDAPGRVTVVGESLVDLLWRPGAREITAVAGGSPANVAVGLHRLERPVTLVTTRGEDHPGRLVDERLDGLGVDVLRVPSGSPRTTVALAHLDAEGSADYDFLASWDPLDLPVPEDTTVLHTGSLAIVLRPGAERVRKLCAAQRAAGRTVAVDLNVRPAVQPDRAAYLAACLAVTGEADVVKASDEDLAWLMPDLDPAAAARRLLETGPRLAVVTLGAGGVLAVTADEEVRVPAVAVEVVDTVGAGDAFQAALLDALAERGGPPADAADLGSVLERCVRAAALTCARTGSQPPDRAELDAVAGRAGL